MDRAWAAVAGGWTLPGQIAATGAAAQFAPFFWACTSSPPSQPHSTATQKRFTRFWQVGAFLWVGIGSFLIPVASRGVEP